MPWGNIKQAKEERIGLAQRMKTLVEEIGEPKNWTDEKDAQFKRMEDDLKSMDSHIDKLEKVEEIIPALDKIEDRKQRDDHLPNPKGPDSDKITHRDRDLAFRAYCLGARARPPQIAAAEKVKANLLIPDARGTLLRQAPKSIADVPRLYAEMRATSDYMNVGTAADGGNIVPDDVMQAIEIFLVAYGGARQSGARVIRTAHGGGMPIPTADDTATTAMGAILAENTATTAHSVPFGQVVLGAYKYTSRLIGVSIELMQDTAFPLGPLLGEFIGTRLGRITNSHFTIGETSDSHPQGFIAASTNSGYTGVTGSTYAEFTYAEIVNLVHSVDPAYRGDATCGWSFCDATLSLFRKMVDSYARPLWQPSLLIDAPDKILGYLYTINQSVPPFSTGSTGNTKTIAFGAMNRHVIRDVMDVDILRLNERYAEQGSVAFLGFQRTDSDLINRNAVKVFLTASSS